jgi:phosphatidylserine/phosphatidylglycerophosphate/cardiolipin synthase-like enzyme
MLPVSILLLLSQAPPVAAPPAAPSAGPIVELVESAPVETTLDHADIRNADVVWKEMIDGAKTALDFAEFYVSDHPGSRLTPIIEAVEKAAQRGVHVRFLAEKSFEATYPETLARFAAVPGIEVRTYDMHALTGGVLHAKYFLVDGTSAYLGSQNFDWRSLEHIQELGVRVASREATAVWQAAFDADWAIAGGAARDAALHATHVSGLPLQVGTGDDAARITPVYSPRDLLPDASLWELPRIIALVDGAKKTVRVQLLTYKAGGRKGEYFAEIEDALRRAAARGVDVQLLVADWCMRKGTIEGLQSLEPLPHVEVKLVTIPPWSGGFVPYARVVHAKYLVADGASAWVGTSNFEQDYFYASRNVGLVIEGGPVPKRLNAFFLDGWNAPYARSVDPCAVYTPPRTKED